MRASLALFVLSCFALAVTQFAVHSTAAQEPAPDAEAPEDLAAEAIEAFARANQALARWANSIEDGAKLRDEDLAEFKRHAQGIGGNIDVIEAHARRAHRDELLAEPDPRSPGEQGAGMGRSDAHPRPGGRRRAGRSGGVDARRAGRRRRRPATRRTAGLVANRRRELRQDRVPGLVFPFVKDSSGSLLVSACYALFNTDRRANDLLLIQEAWTRRSAALNNAMSHLLFMYSDGVIEGRSEEIILELLDSPHADARRETLRGIWGASVSDRLAARVVEWADDPESHGDAIYFGLSTFKPKNEAVVDKLIETLTDPDWNNWDRALWGLGYGVPEELQPRAAEALVEMYAARSDPRTREKCRDLIRQYAGEEAVEALPQ